MGVVMSYDKEEEERKKLAAEIVDELLDRLSKEVGRSVLRKALWGLVLAAVAIAYVKLPFK